MEAKTIKKAMQLADGLAGLFRTASNTLGPPLLRYAGDETEGERFTGLRKEQPAIAGTIETPKAKPQHKFGTAITYCCAACGSADVRIESYAEWNVEEQKWQPQSVYIRAAECARCQGPTALMPTPVSKPHAANGSGPHPYQPQA